MCLLVSSWSFRVATATVLMIAASSKDQCICKAVTSKSLAPTVHNAATATLAAKMVARSFSRGALDMSAQISAPGLEVHRRSRPARMNISKAAEGEPPAALSERIRNLVLRADKGELWAFM